MAALHKRKAPPPKRGSDAGEEPGVGWSILFLFGSAASPRRNTRPELSAAVGPLAQLGDRAGPVLHVDLPAQRRSLRRPSRGCRQVGNRAAGRRQCANERKCRANRWRPAEAAIGLLLRPWHAGNTSAPVEPQPRLDTARAVIRHQPASEAPDAGQRDGCSIIPTTPRAGPVCPAMECVQSARNRSGPPSPTSTADGDRRSSPSTGECRTPCTPSHGHQNTTSAFRGA